MNWFIRYLICFCAAFAALYISGFGSLMGGISDSLAVSIMVRASLFPSGLALMIWEGYLLFSKKNKALSDKVSELEDKIAKLKESKN